MLSKKEHCNLNIFLPFLGGFDGTSNVLAGKLFNIPVKGTHAHSYITSYSGFSELKSRVIKHKETGKFRGYFQNSIYIKYQNYPGVSRDLLDLAVAHRSLLESVLDIPSAESSDGELAAMVSFAIAFPAGFMALVDTYDVKRYFSFQANLSRMPNCNLCGIFTFWLWFGTLCAFWFVCAR